MDVEIEYQNHWCVTDSMPTLQLDPEFKATVDLIRQGEFGYEDFFSDVLDSITTGPDYYLLANDFQSYIQAQVDALYGICYMSGYICFRLA